MSCANRKTMSCLNRGTISYMEPGTTRRTRLGVLLACATLASLLAGCGDEKLATGAGTPPPLKVERLEDRNLFPVEHPNQFPLTAAVEYTATPEFKATGVIQPDINRSVPVISIASGRVVDIRARLGDTVKKGDVLLRVQSADMTAAFSDYQKAVADEKLTSTQLERAELLYAKGAISLNDLQIARDADAKAKVDVKTTTEKLQLLGNPDLDKPSGVVDIRAPISGVITDQQVTNASGIPGLGSPNPFTISDLSSVWVVCDIYENELAQLHVGENVDIRLNAFPDKVFTGTVSNIGSVLDPNIRSVKVRIVVPNPGMMRPGMFVTATFHGQKKERRASVPATAILHLHDRDWVYIPAGDKTLRRVEVKGGQMLPNNMQEIISGISPDQQVVTNALEFQNAVQQ